MESNSNRRTMDSAYLEYSTIQSILSIYEPDIILATDSEWYDELSTILGNYRTKLLEIKRG